MIEDVLKTIYGESKRHGFEESFTSEETTKAHESFRLTVQLFITAINEAKNPGTEMYFQEKLDSLI